MDAGKTDPIAALGEFFALPAADPATWRPIRSLCGDQAAVHEYTMRTRAATAVGFGIDETDVPVKAAASSVHLSITARLRGTAEFAGGRFRRRSCCLFYQVPGGGYCGDCVLVD